MDAIARPESTTSYLNKRRDHSPAFEVKRLAMCTRGNARKSAHPSWSFGGGRLQLPEPE
jgi:hypothetical protein